VRKSTWTEINREASKRTENDENINMDVSHVTVSERV